MRPARKDERLHLTGTYLEIALGVQLAGELSAPLTVGGRSAFRHPAGAWRVARGGRAVPAPVDWRTKAKPAVRLRGITEGRPKATL